MKKTFSLLITVLLLQQAISQTEIFDIATYTPPKDWKKEANTGVVNYTSVNTTTGKFCIITLYASKASTGDVQKDFNNEWKELVALKIGLVTFLLSFLIATIIKPGYILNNRAGKKRGTFMLPAISVGEDIWKAFASFAKPEKVKHLEVKDTENNFHPDNKR